MFGAKGKTGSGIRTELLSKIGIYENSYGRFVRS